MHDGTMMQRHVRQRAHFAVGRFQIDFCDADEGRKGKFMMIKRGGAGTFT